MKVHKAFRFGKEKFLQNILVSFSVAFCMVCALILSSSTAKAQACPDAASSCSSVEIRNCTPYTVDFLITYCDGNGNVAVSSVLQIDAAKCDPPTPYSVPGIIIEIEPLGSAPPVNVDFNHSTCSVMIN